jgi:hypothetical protein
MHRRSSVTVRLSACLLLLAVAWSLALAQSPALHASMHADSHEPQHQCAATIFHSGACETAPVQQSAPAPALAHGRQIAAIDGSMFSASLFAIDRDRGPPLLMALQLFTT